jgi:hypothetical protein
MGEAEILLAIFFALLIGLFILADWIQREDRRRLLNRLNLKEGEPLVRGADQYLTTEGFRLCRTRQELEEKVAEGRQYAEHVRDYTALQPRKETTTIRTNYWRRRR